MAVEAWLLDYFMMSANSGIIYNNINNKKVSTRDFMKIVIAQLI